MMTTAILVLGVGSLLGGALGWKLGRTYERVRGTKKTATAIDKTGGSKRKASLR